MGTCLLLTAYCCPFSFFLLLRNLRLQARRASFQAEKAKREQEEKEKLEQEAQEQAKREQEEKAKREQEEQAKREQKEKDKREQEEKAKREQEEQAKREQEEKEKREQEEKAKLEQEEKAKREQEEKGKLEAMAQEGGSEEGEAAESEANSAGPESADDDVPAPASESTAANGDTTGGADETSDIPDLSPRGTERDRTSSAGSHDSVLATMASDTISPLGGQDDFPDLPSDEDAQSPSGAPPRPDTSPDVPLGKTTSDVLLAAKSDSVPSNNAAEGDSPGVPEESPNVDTDDQKATETTLAPADADAGDANAPADVTTAAPDTQEAASEQKQPAEEAFPEMSDSDDDDDDEFMSLAPLPTDMTPVLGTTTTDMIRAMSVLKMPEDFDDVDSDMAAELDSGAQPAESPGDDGAEGLETVEEDADSESNSADDEQQRIDAAVEAMAAATLAKIDGDTKPEPSAEEVAEEATAPIIEKDDNETSAEAPSNEDSPNEEVSASNDDGGDQAATSADVEPAPTDDATPTSSAADVVFETNEEVPGNADEAEETTYSAGERAANTDAASTDEEVTEREPDVDANATVAVNTEDEELDSEFRPAGSALEPIVETSKPVQDEEQEGDDDNDDDDDDETASVEMADLAADAAEDGDAKTAPDFAVLRQSTKAQMVSC